MNFKKRVNGSWVDTPNYIHKTDADTFTTLPAVIHPTGTTATVGLKGNTLQSSIPSPTSLIMPQGTGEKTGNLVFVSVDNLTYYLNYNQFTISDGTITVTGRMLIGFKVKVTPNTTYTASAVYSSVRPQMRIREYTEIPDDWIEGFIGQPVNTKDTSATFTTSSEAEWILVVFYSEFVGATIDKVMLNLGSTALPYEPYGYKIPISSANTTTPVYLGEVETTRRIKKLVLDGTENWTYRSGDPANVFFMYLPTAKTGEVAMSNAYPYYIGTDFVDMNDKEFAIIRNNLSIRNSDYQYESQFKAYLAAQYAAGTPVCVWYVLATSTTGIVNEPIRKIGNYADTLSMEQAGVQIPTNRGNTVIDVLTELKPSEIEIEYTGWHDASVKESDGSDWQ